MTDIAYSQTENTDIDIVKSLSGRSKRLIINEYMQLMIKKKILPGVYIMNMKRKVVEKGNHILLKEYAAIMRQNLTDISYLN